MASRTDEDQNTFNDHLMQKSKYNPKGSHTFSCNCTYTVKDSEMRMVLLGKTGSGKRATGNTILNEKKLNVNSTFQHLTRESVRVYRPVNGRTVWVIDTLGLFNGGMATEELKEQLEEAVYLAHPGVHVFLLVMRLGVRFTGEEKNTVSWIVENFGEEAQKHIIVFFTHGNKLKKRTIKQNLQEHSVVKEIIGRMADYHVFENENENDEIQVKDLLKIDKVVDKNENQIYTRKMYS